MRNYFERFCHSHAPKRKPCRGPGTDAEASRAPRGLRREIGRRVHRPSSPSRSRHTFAATVPATQPGRHRTGAHVAIAPAHAATPRPWHARHCPTALSPGIKTVLDPPRVCAEQPRATPTPEPPHCHSRSSRRATPAGHPSDVAPLLALL
jgi:hypothetical protein